jgi:hypothetical protein
MACFFIVSSKAPGIFHPPEADGKDPRDIRRSWPGAADGHPVLDTTTEKGVLLSHHDLFQPAVAEKR